MFKANSSNTYIPAKSLSVKPESQVPYGKGQGPAGNESLLDQVKFNIPSYLGFIDPRETYLKYKITMTGRGKPKPDPRGGVHSLIRDFRIQDGTASTTLEEVQDYNCLVNTWWDYTANQSINDKRDMYEGRSASNNPNAQLYYGNNPDHTAGAVRTISGRNQVEVLQPLHSGILGGGKVFPVVATKGLRITMNLANVLQSLTYNSGNDGMENDLSPNTPNGFFTLKNAKALNADQKAAVNSEFGITIQRPEDSAVGRGIFRNAVPYNNNPFERGDKLIVSLSNGTQPFEIGVITGFDIDGDGDCQVLYIPDRAVGVGTPTQMPIGSRVFVRSPDRETAAAYQVPANLPADLATANNVPWGYKIEDLELICSVINPPAEYVNRLMKQVSSGQGLNLDIKTYHTYRNNLNVLNGLTNQLIPATEQRAYSILSVPVSDNNLVLGTPSTWQGNTGGVQNYQYIFGGTQIPDREIDLRKYSNGANKPEALHLIELEKALVNCGYSVRNLQNVPNRFLIARGFSKYNQVFNLKDRDLSLRVEYNGALATDTRTYYHFVCHLRRIVINANGIQTFW